MKNNKEELKQVILVNDYLGMSTGKLLAQTSHASMAFLTSAMRSGSYEDNKENDILKVNFKVQDNIYKNWLVDGSFAKLVLSVRSEDELDQTIKRMKKFGLVDGFDYFPIIDQGRTQFAGVRTWTCTGTKPIPQDLINKLFGSLPLLK